MTHTQTQKRASTYSLLVQSEQAEAGRSILETAIYGLFLVSTVLAMWQVAVQTSALPTYKTGDVKLVQFVSAQQPS